MKAAKKNLLRNNVRLLINLGQTIEQLNQLQIKS